jgi:hypothetical protein
LATQNQPSHHQQLHAVLDSSRFGDIWKSVLVYKFAHKRWLSSVILSTTSRMITSTDQTQNIWFSKASNLYFNGTEINVDDVVQFLSGTEGVVYASQRTINTAIKLDEAVFRNASSAIPSGILQVQPNSESMSATDLQELAATFNEARMTQTIAALSPEVHYQELMTSPDKMMLVQSSEFMQMQISRIVGVPAYLLNLSVGSYAYTNSAEARQDVWTFAAKNVAECISQTLSMNQILPNGTLCQI